MGVALLTAKHRQSRLFLCSGSGSGTSLRASRATLLKMHLDAQRWIVLYQMFQSIFLTELCFWHLLPGFWSSQSLTNPRSHGMAACFDSNKAGLYAIQGPGY